MCGIVGFIDKSKNKKKIIKDMADLIEHRGPDSSGYYTNDEVAFGFRRLSIIDLSDGSQPIYNEKEDKLIFFNGEVYNYESIRKELIDKGHKFKTNTDTEVILHGYEEYGKDILNKLRGMFAFIIYDIENNKLFGARDFFGIKPFYYYQTDDEFMFGSEIKSFLGHPNFKKELNKKMLQNYLTYQYSVGEDTFFKNVFKLRPGHCFTYENNHMHIEKYYNITFEPDDKTSLSKFKKGIREVIDDSVLAHKVSDVEVGSFLSSGVDSSLIATLSKVDKTFTVGYEEKKYSEIDYAEDLSEKIGVENISKKISREEYFSNFSNIQYYMDEPLADPSAICLYFVAELASKHVKVALSGEGSDEIFGGYNIYHEPYSVSWYYKIPYIIRRGIGILVYPFRHHRGFNFLYRRSRKLEDRYIGNAFMFEPSETKKILKEVIGDNDYRDFTKEYYDKISNYDDVSKMQYIDFHLWLVGDILLKADKMSMANSLEVRVPYLDKVLFEYAKKIPTKYKIKDGQTKYAFRQVAKEVLEDKFADKKKLGFPVPIREWIKDDKYFNEIKDTFIGGSEFFNTDEIIKLLEDHKEGRKDNSRKIWTIYSFLVWYKEYFVIR